MVTLPSILPMQTESTSINSKLSTQHQNAPPSDTSNVSDKFSSENLEILTENMTVTDDTTNKDTVTQSE